VVLVVKAKSVFQLIILMTYLIHPDYVVGPRVTDTTMVVQDVHVDMDIDNDEIVEGSPHELQENRATPSQLSGSEGYEGYHLVVLVLGWRVM
jgi:hypothetical protein